MRISDLTPIGEILGDGEFWEPNEKADYAAKMMKRTDSYTDGNGIVRCRACREPLMFYLAEAKRWLPCACACKADDGEREENIEELKRQSGIEGRYKAADFEKFDVTKENEGVFQSCLRYAVNYGQIRQRGLGMYLYGASGAGKTYLAACVANMLLNAGKQVVFANVNAILSEIRYAYSQRGSERPIIERYVTSDLAIFDDIGTEKYTKASEAVSFAQDKFFQIIDGRYIRQKPTIFTSNYSLQQLVEERGIMLKTVERITEMSTRKFELKGKSRRLERIGNVPF